MVYTRRRALQKGRFIVPIVDLSAFRVYYKIKLLNSSR